MVGVRVSARIKPLHPEGNFIRSSPAPSYETGQEGSGSQPGTQDVLAGVHTGKIERSALETNPEVISHSRIKLGNIGKHTTLPLLGSKWNIEWAT